MVFPEAKRYIYKTPPLDKVVCQMKFPTILRINNESPTEFQEIIRKNYPLYDETLETTIDLPQELMDQIGPMMTQAIGQQPVTKNYHFSSIDDIWHINLTKNFVALSCNKYLRWEDFKSHLITVLEALNTIYHPSFYSRIGLRYINIFCRSTLNLNEYNWSDLLKPYISGVFSNEEIEPSIIEAVQHIKLSLTKINNSYVQINSGLATNQLTNEKCFIIDSDIYKLDQVRIEDGINTLYKFHTEGRNLFQWFITEKLHNAMGPEAC